MATKHFFQIQINGVRGTHLFAGSYDACLRFIAANHGTDAVATSLKWHQSPFRPGAQGLSLTKE